MNKEQEDRIKEIRFCLETNTYTEGTSPDIQFLLDLVEELKVGNKELEQIKYEKGYYLAEHRGNVQVEQIEKQLENQYFHGVEVGIEQGERLRDLEVEQLQARLALAEEVIEAGRKCLEIEKSRNYDLSRNWGQCEMSETFKLFDQALTKYKEGK